MKPILAIVVGSAAVGVGYLVYRNREAAKQTEPEDQPTKEQAAGNVACNGLSALLTSVGLPMTPEMCQQGLGFGSKVLDVVQSLNNVAAKVYGEEKRRDDVNKSLNGKAKVVRPVFPVADYQDVAADHRATGGTVLEFENGCQPFAGAPGWSKCKPGTLDMWTPAFDGRVSDGDIKAQNAYPTFEQYEAARKAHTVERALIKGALRSGSPGDASTAGPRPTKDGTKLQWWVRGTVVECAKGTAPKTILQGAQIRDHRDNPSGTYAATYDDNDDITCVPVDAALAASSPGAPATSSVSTQQVACVGTQPAAGFTWDPTNGGFWRRLKAGEKPNPGPCDPNAKPSSKSWLLDAATLAVVNGAFASRQ